MTHLFSSKSLTISAICYAVLFGPAPAQESVGPSKRVIVLRSWLDPEVFKAVAYQARTVDLSVSLDGFSFESAEHVLDPGFPIKQLAFDASGETTFALLEGGQTLVRYQGGLPLIESGRLQMTAPTDDLVVLRDYLVLFQKNLGRLEFRKLADLDAKFHWKPKEGQEIRGIGLSPKEERAPLIIWTRTPQERNGFFYQFEFLDPKTFKSQPWKASIESGEEQIEGNYHESRQGEGILSRLKVSDDGRTAGSRFFTLSFGQNNQVQYEPVKSTYWENSRQRFLGRSLPFGFSGFRVMGASENHVFIAEPRRASSVAVLDRATLAPICLILGFADKIERMSGGAQFTGKGAWSATFNEAAGHLHLRKEGSSNGFVYQLDTAKIRKVFPFQSCATHLPLQEDEVGIMTISFAAGWEGAGHQFQLLEAPQGSSIDESSGEARIPIPPNQAPGSELLVSVKGTHRDGTTVLLQTSISIPYPK